MGSGSTGPWRNANVLTMVAVTALGLAGITAYAGQVGGPEEFWRIAAVSCLVAGAAGLVGDLLGFLFGIPRTLQGERPVRTVNGPPTVGVTTGPRGGADDPAPRRTEYLVNTNLEQISDWLTKILVGVGLTQLGEVPARLNQMASFLAPGLGGGASAELYSVALVLYFLIAGFLGGYLWTRLVLAGAFKSAEVEALGERLERVERNVEGSSGATQP